MLADFRDFVVVVYFGQVTTSLVLCPSSSVCVCVCAYVRACVRACGVTECVHACVCVCVCERERNLCNGRDRLVTGQNHLLVLIYHSKLYLLLFDKMTTANVLKTNKGPNKMVVRCNATMISQVC